MEHYKQISQKQNVIPKKITFLLVFSIILSACHNETKIASQEIQIGENQVLLTLSTTKPDITNESRIHINNYNFTNWRKIEINSKKSFNHLEFVDDMHGWIASEDGKLYQTTDGGKIWKSLILPFVLHSKTSLTNLTFINPLLGWIILEEQGKNWEDSIIKLFHTEDGGQRWILQFSGEGIHISKLIFANDQTGWAVGSKTVKKEILYGEFFVLHTSNGGESWTDISEQLFNFVNIEKSNVHEIMDVFITEPNRAVILTGENRLFETDDSGENWKPVGEINLGNKSPQFVSLPNRNFNILAGIDNKEGIDTIFLTRKDNNSWAKNILSGFYLKDAIYLSENQLFACGSMLPKGYKGINDGRRLGVVLYSSDHGDNWTIIYQNAQVEKISEIKISNKEQLWLVGDKGLILTVSIKDINKYIRSGNNRDA